MGEILFFVIQRCAEDIRGKSKVRSPRRAKTTERWNSEKLDLVTYNFAVRTGPFRSLLLSFAIACFWGSSQVVANKRNDVNDPGGEIGSQIQNPEVSFGIPCLRDWTLIPLSLHNLSISGSVPTLERLKGNVHDK